MDTPDFGQVGAPVVVLVHVEALVAGDHGADVSDEFASPRHGAEIEVLLLRDGQGLVVDVPVVALSFIAPRIARNKTGQVISRLVSVKLTKIIIYELTARDCFLYVELLHIFEFLRTIIVYCFFLFV